jgi:ferric iron reductase protein FhuF
VNPPPDLTPVTGADASAAIERAGSTNALLGIGTGSDGDPADRLCAVDLVDAIAEWAGTGERRVAASLVVLGYSARLVGATLAVLLRDGILLDTRPSQVRYSFQPERGFRLTLPQPTGWRGPPDALRRRWCADIIDDHLSHLIDAVRAAAPVAPGLLWGNVASGLAGTLRALTQSGLPLATGHTVGVQLLDHGPLRESGTLSIHDGQLTFLRRSCCLYYRLDGGGMCGDCPLVGP